jgi:branched-chain amino acid transport system substrate-binding protein
MNVFARAARTVAAILTVATLVTPPLAAQAPPVTISAVLSLTGGAASIGTDEAAALRVYESVVNRQGGINGTPVHFAVLDDQSSPQVAVQLATTVLATHPPLMLGSSLAGTTQAMVPLFKNGPVLYASTPVIYPDKGSFVFAAGVSSRHTTAAAMRYFRMKGLTRFALVTTNDASGQDYLRTTDLALGLPENKNVSVVDRESFTPTDISIAPQVEKIKASGAQALLIYATGAPFGTVLRGLFDAGVSLPIDTTGPNFNPVLLDRFKTFMPKSEMIIGGASFFKRDRKAGDPLKAAIDEFYDALGANGIKPTASHVFTWDPAHIAIAALRKFGTGMTAVQFRDYVNGLHDFAGVAGLYDFRNSDGHGLTQDSVVVIRYNPNGINGEGIVVSDQGGAPRPGM